MTNGNDSMTHWRGWAAMLLLAKFDNVRTSMFEPRLRCDGWAVYGVGNCTQQTRRALVALEGNGLVERSQYLNAEANWSLTALGLQFVEKHLRDNPHVTPQKSVQRWMSSGVEPWACIECGSAADRYDNGEACETCVLTSFAENG